MSEHAVVIAGGGPTGMMLAAELTLAGTDVLIVERRASFSLESSRSRGLHSRTIEVLDQRGVVDRFLAEGKAVQVQAFAGVPMDISDFPTRHNYGMALLQSHFERILAGWIDELGVPILRERDVTGFKKDGWASPSSCPIWTVLMSPRCRTSATRSSGLTARTTECIARTGSRASPT